MRRMYSEQELTNVIKKVFEEELESGALDELVSDAVDAYLVEHPVDPTAITGLDIAPKDVSATGNITAPSIIETMSGYSYTKTGDAKVTQNDVFVGAVKNGNKLTFVYFGELTATESVSGSIELGYFTIPSAIGAKLYPYEISGYNTILDQKALKLWSGFTSGVDAVARIEKATNAQINVVVQMANAVVSQKYYFRYEVTFLLSENLIPEE